MTAATCVSALHFYPLKSGAPVDLRSARIGNEGLKGDRQMMVVDEAGKCITARANPRLFSIHTVFDLNETTLLADGVGHVTFRRDGLTPMPVNIWGTDVVALDAGDEAADWLSAHLKVSCRLAVKGERSHRPLTLTPGGEMSFADTAPLLLTNSASLEDLNRYLEEPVPMRRFRPNLVMDDAEAFAEDGWGRIRVGEVEFIVAGPCDRCIMVTQDPATGVPAKNVEPLALLGKQRRGDDGNVYFGQFLIPCNDGRINLGDSVEVLERKTPVSLTPGTAVPVPRLPSPTAKDGGSTAPRERELRCVGIVDEARDLRTFRFVSTDGAAITYLPGQFITLMPEIDGETPRRSFTISSSPSRPHHISVTVRRTRGGGISDWLHSELKLGDTLRAYGPLGRFHLAAANDCRRLLMLSAGSGITPMISMLRFIADADLPYVVHFHHSARTRDDIGFADELSVLARHMPDRLKLSWNLTADAVEGLPKAEAGRLDGAMLSRLCPDIANRTVFACGPDGFRQMARQAHGTLAPSGGWPFLEEAFGIDAASVEALPEIGEWSVEFTTAGRMISGHGTTTILAAAREAGVELNAACEAGICGTCRCRVEEGEWRLAANAADPERGALSATEKETGYVLACSTTPIGNMKVAL